MSTGPHTAPNKCLVPSDNSAKKRAHSPLPEELRANRNLKMETIYVNLSSCEDVNVSLVVGTGPHASIASRTRRDFFAKNDG